jgi:hypothetical protein
MADPVTLIIGGLILGATAIVSGISTAAENQAAEAAAEAEQEALETQAEIAALEAEAVRKAGEHEIGVRTEQFGDLQSAAVNVYGYAGVEVGEGSPLKTLQTSQARFEADVASIREQMELGVQKWESAEEGYLAQIPLLQEALKYQQQANWWTGVGNIFQTGFNLFF